MPPPAAPAPRPTIIRSWMNNLDLMNGGVTDRIGLAFF
jgi:hypothetical protein